MDRGSLNKTWKGRESLFSSCNKTSKRQILTKAPLIREHGSEIRRTAFFLNDGFRFNTN